jgi:putative membrane protein
MGPGPWIGFAHRAHEGPGWGVWVLGILLTVAFWALVVLAIVWLVRSFSNRGTGTAPGGRHWAGGRSGGPAGYYAPPAAGPATAGPVRGGGAEQILAERFARGEIDEGEYRGRLAVLRGSAEGTPPAPEEPGQPPA